MIQNEKSHCIVVIFNIFLLNDIVTELLWFMLALDSAQSLNQDKVWAIGGTEQHKK